jgi:hypothetical protein
MSKQENGGVPVTLPDGHSVTFDFSRISARAMGRFFQAARDNDIEGVSATLALIVIDCPYGPADQPDTYAELPYFGAFSDLVEATIDGLKNVRTR